MNGHVLFFIILTLFCSCQKNPFGQKTQIGSSFYPGLGLISKNIIKGKVYPLEGSIAGVSSGPVESAYASLCADDVYARLYQLSADGTLPETALSSQKLDSDATFTFNTSTLGLAHGTEVKYFIMVTGCDLALSRPVTNFDAGQDVNMLTTLIGYTVSADLNKKLTEVPRKDVYTLLKDLKVADSSSTNIVFQNINGRPALEQKFQRVFQNGISSLQTAPPKIIKETAPLYLQENLVSEFSVQATHWDPGYTVAYSWKLNGIEKSRSSFWTYTPGANEQGTKILTLTLGKDNGSGGIDTSVPYLFKSYDLTVLNSVLPLPLTMFSTQSLVNSREVTITLDSGASMVNCSSFDSLAITENLDLPPATSEFNINCSTNFTQTLNYQISTTGDGTKTIRLWSIDASGTISGSPTILTFELDTQGPSISLTALPSKIKGGISRSVSFTLGDAVSASLSLSTNGTTYTPLSSLITSPYNWSVPQIDSATLRLKLEATDLGGNTTTVVSPIFEIDSTAPTIGTFTRTSAAISGSSATSFSLSSCNGAAYAFLGEDSTPGMTDSGWQACDTSLSYTLSGSTQGTRTIKIWVMDNVGNISSSSSATMVYDTIGPLITITTPTSKRGGETASLNFILTEENATSSNSIVVEFFNGSSWSNVGSVTAFAGNNSARAYSLNLTYPIVDSSISKVRVSYIDIAGNSNSGVTENFLVDSTAPTMNLLSINNGVSTVTSTVLNVRVNASDTASGAAAVRMAESSSTCQSAYNNSGWIPLTTNGVNQTLSYTSSFSPGNKRLCAWAKDAVGNVSEVTSNSGLGTQGVDTYVYFLDVGNPPRFTSLAVFNNSPGLNFGTKKFTSGDQLKVSFTIEDNEGLATQPITIYSSTDGSNYNLLVPASTVGSLTGGSTTSWTYDFTGAIAPSSSFFRLMLISQDASGNTASTFSEVLNSGAWEIYAGTDNAGNNTSAISARILGPAEVRPAMTSDGTIYIPDYNGSCIRKINPGSGIISNYICYGGSVPTGVPGTISSTTRIPGSPDRATSGKIMADGTDLYIWATLTSPTVHGVIYRINTLTNYIEKYAGGGTQVATNVADAMNLFINNAFGAKSWSLDPKTKSIYMLNSCNTTPGADPNSTAAIQVIKINQNSTTKAATSAEVVAGNCLRGPLINGADALSSPINNTSVWVFCCSSLHFDSITDTLYARGGIDLTFKLVNGKIYGLPGISLAGLAISVPDQGRVFFNGASGGIESFIPSNAPTSTETFSTYIIGHASATNPSCANDGLSVASACTYAGGLFNAGPLIGFIDGNFWNSTGISRIRVVDNSNIVRTIAGTRSLSGIGNSRQTVQFGSIRNLLFKSTTTGPPTNLGTGLYIADSQSLTLTRVNPISNVLELIAGNQISKDPIPGSTFGETFLGVDLSTFSVATSAFDQNGLFVWQGGNMISRQTSTNTISTIGGTGNAMDLTLEGATSYRSPDNGGGTGLVVDPQGRIYYGGYRRISNQYSSYPRIGFINPGDNKYYRVIGADAPASSTTSTIGDAVSSDGPVKNAGVFKTISCIDPLASSSYAFKGVGSCYIQYEPRYQLGVGRLLFAERNKIRFVAKPYDSVNSTLGTLVDATRGVGAFIVKYVDSGDENNESVDRIYYISSGALYCIKITGSPTTGCNNTSLGPPAGMPGLSSTSLTMDPSSGYLYMTSSNNQVIYRINPSL